MDRKRVNRKRDTNRSTMSEFISQIILSQTIYMLILAFIGTFRLDLRLCVLITGLIFCSYSLVLCIIGELKLRHEKVNLINILGLGVYVLAYLLMNLDYRIMYIGLLLLTLFLMYKMIESFYLDVIKNNFINIIGKLIFCLFGVCGVAMIITLEIYLLWDVSYVLSDNVPEAEGFVEYASVKKSAIIQNIRLGNGLEITRILDRFVKRGDYIIVKYLPHSKYTLDVEILNR